MTLCRIMAGAFAALWAGALAILAILAIGTFGWFGQERDPLSAVYLVFLGLPWTRLAGAAGVASPVVGLLAPGLNLIILYLICRALAGRSRKRGPKA